MSPNETPADSDREGGGPRRERARLWAGLYAGIFGAPAGGTTDDAPPEPESGIDADRNPSDDGSG